jgi:hypothetical protein
MVTALGVAQDADGNGLDALTHRRLISYGWTNLGVVGGLSVSGAPGLRYQATAGKAVCSLGEADGCVEAYWPGGPTAETVDAADSTYPRVDTVYLLAPTEAGGQVALHVAQGTPSAVPGPPSLPAGALRLRDMQMPAGASSTQSAAPVGSVDYAIPYGAEAGRIAHFWSRDNGTGSVELREPFNEFHCGIYLPTNRMLEFCFDCVYSALDGKDSQWSVGFCVDDKVLEGSTVNFGSDDRWLSHQTRYLANVPSGAHTVSIVSWLQFGSAPVFHYGPNENGLGTYVGRRFQVWDRGPAQ